MKRFLPFIFLSTLMACSLQAANSDELKLTQEEKVQFAEFKTRKNDNTNAQNALCIAQQQLLLDEEKWMLEVRKKHGVDTSHVYNLDVDKQLFTKLR